MGTARDDFLDKMILIKGRSIIMKLAILSGENQFSQKERDIFIAVLFGSSMKYESLFYLN